MVRRRIINHVKLKSKFTVIKNGHPKQHNNTYHITIVIHMVEEVRENQSERPRRYSNKVDYDVQEGYVEEMAEYWGDHFTHKGDDNNDLPQKETRSSLFKFRMQRGNESFGEERNSDEADDDKQSPLIESYLSPSRTTSPSALSRKKIILQGRRMKELKNGEEEPNESHEDIEEMENETQEEESIDQSKTTVKSTSPREEGGGLVKDIELGMEQVDSTSLTIVVTPPQELASSRINSPQSNMLHNSARTRAKCLTSHLDLDLFSSRSSTAPNSPSLSLLSCTVGSPNNRKFNIRPHTRPSSAFGRTNSNPLLSVPQSLIDKYKSPTQHSTNRNHLSESVPLLKRTQSNQNFQSEALRSISMLKKSEHKDKVALKLEHLGMSHDQDAHGYKTLDDFDESSSDAILLTSPRSIEVCLNLGVAAQEFIKRPKSDFEDRHAAAEIVEMRFEHYNMKRLELLNRAREERKRIISEHRSRFDSHVDSKGDHIKSVLEQEKERVERRLERTKRNYEELIRHEVQMKRADCVKREEEMRRLKNDLAERRRKQKEQRQIHELTVQRQLDFKRMVQEKLQEQQEKMARRAKEFEALERERSNKLRQSRDRRIQQTQSRRIEKSNRIEAARNKVDEALAKRQEELDQRQRKIEQRRRKIEDLKLQKRRKMRKRAQEREEHIKQTLRMNEILERKKIEMIKEKQRQQQEAEEERRKQERIQAEQKRVLAKRREESRAAKLQSVQKAEQAEALRLLERLYIEDLKHVDAQEQRQREHERRLEEVRLRELDKRESVERMKRVAEYKKILAITKIEDKQRKADGVKREREKLVIQRQNQSEIIRRSKEILRKVQPKTEEQEQHIIDLITSTISSTSCPSEVDWADLEKQVTSASSSARSTQL